LTAGIKANSDGSAAIQVGGVDAITLTSAGAATFVQPITLTTPIGFSSGGTGQTTRQAAMDALAGAVTAGQYLRGDGTDVVMSAIQAADVPTLNQNTTGSAATFTSTTQNSQFNSVGIGTAALGTAGTLNMGGTGSSQLNMSGYNAYGGTGYHGFLQVTNTFGGATNPNKYFRLNSTGGVEVVNSAYNVILFTLDNSGSITAAGNVTAYSDERYKTNWRGVAPDFVEKLAAVKSGIYDRTDEEITQAGVSAQSWQNVLPETVLTGDDGRLSVAYGNAALVACVELAKEVVALRKELDALKGK